MLNAYLFDSIGQVRILTDKWMDEYNNLHPHKSLNGKTSNKMAEQLNYLSLNEII